MLTANFKPKRKLQHRALSLRQHGFLVVFELGARKGQMDGRTGNTRPIQDGRIIK